jgi:hypothetical protein
MQFIVTNADGYRTENEDDRHELFFSHENALARAEEIASENAGYDVEIWERKTIVRCSVSEPTVVDAKDVKDT